MRCSIMQISQYNTFYFIRYAHFKYTKCLTHRNNGMCKKDPFFLRKIRILRVIRELLGLKMRNFHGIIFI